MSKVAFIAGTRIVAAVIIALALGVQAWADLTYGTFTWSELPGYFTPLAAIAAAVALVASVVWAPRSSKTGSRATEPSWVSLLRVNAATYGVITGAVYWAFLGGVATPVFPWANFILHGGAGAILVADWLFIGKRERLPLSTVWTVLVVPGLWISYLLIRSHIDGWVPYAFLDPALGAAAIAKTVGTIAAVGVAVAVALHLMVRRRSISAISPISGTEQRRRPLNSSRPAM